MFTRRHLHPATAVAALVMAAAPAFAHSHPVSMTPAKDSTVGAPKEISVMFSEDLEPKFSSLKLQDASGKVVSTDQSVLDAKNAKHLTLQLPSLPAGVYTVLWISSSSDGHREQGKYSFTIK